MIIETILDHLLDYAFSEGREKFRESKKVDQLRSILRARLLREARFNRAVAEDLEEDFSSYIQELDSRVLEELFSQAIPLDDLFPRKLSEEDKGYITKGKPLFNGRIEGLKTEADLIERLWHRIAVARFRRKNKLELGDVQYLQALIFGLIKVLAKGGRS